MEENFDADKFISLVKTKESIWNYKSKAYANKAQRKDDWMEICEAMIDDFATKTNGEKSAAAIEFQAKWKVLRDGFTRSIKNHRKKTGKEGSKGKLYMYYTQLQFLNDLYEDKELVCLNDETSSVYKDEPCRKRQKKAYETASENNDSLPKSEKQDNIDKRVHNSTLHNAHKIDVDTHFFLSLVPDFRKIPIDQRLDAKGDIINVIRHYRNTPSIQFQTIGSYYTNDIAALATTSTERPNSCGSNYFDPKDTSCEVSPSEIKFITSP